jgi:hypothetical protein
VSNFEDTVEQMKQALQDHAKKKSTTVDNAPADSRQHQPILSTDQSSSSTSEGHGQNLSSSSTEIGKTTEQTPPEGQPTSNTYGWLIKDGTDGGKDRFSRVERSQEVSPANSEPSELETQKEISRNLQDIGPVVATLNLDDVDDDDWSDDGVYYDNENEDDMENDFGMTNIGSELSPAYIKEMEALMKEHEIKQERKATGADSTLNDTFINVGGNVARRSAPKGVRFAESLDIASSGKSNSVQSLESKPTDANPLSDTIVERESTTRPQPAEAPKKKISRFKAAHQSQKQPQIEFAGDQDMKNEFSLYRERMNIPGHQIDRSLFTENDELDMYSYEDKPKMSKFKAARLGYIVDSDED